MNNRVIPLVGVFCIILGFVLFHCNLPAPPPGAEAARVTLFVKSSNNETNNFSITDTAGEIGTHIAVGC